jgi:hypothetical protein
MFKLVGTARFLNNLHHALLIVKKIGKPNNLNSLGTSKAEYYKDYNEQNKKKSFG